MTLIMKDFILNWLWETLWSGWNVRFSCSIRRVVSSILASGTKIFFVPGEDGFSSFQVKMFTGSVCVLVTVVSLKLIKIKIKLIYATTSSCEKKQNGGWKLSDTDWFYFSFYNPSCFFYMIRVDPSQILFYFYFFIRSELDQADSSWSGLAVRVDPVRLLYLSDSEAYMLLVDSKKLMSRTYDLFILILKQTKRKKASTKDCSIKSREWHLRRTCCWLQCKSKTHDSQRVYSLRNLSSF